MRWKHLLAEVGIALLLATGSMPSVAASEVLSAQAKSAVVMIIKYNHSGDFLGWGSGFFVDDGIVVTNRHVVEGASYFRVFTTGENDAVNQACYRTLSLSDVKVNLDNDVAYVRAYVDCPHGVVDFAQSDAKIGDSVGVLGYPLRHTFAESLGLVQTSGTVTGTDDNMWMVTDAFVDFGNSGGPVVSENKVVGVVVAKRIDEQGTFLAGLFVPASIIMKGLAATDSTFGYVPRTQQSSAVSSALSLPPPTDADCKAVFGQNTEEKDGQCRCLSGFQRDITGTLCVRSEGVTRAPRSGSSSSSASSASSAGSAAGKTFEARVCERVRRSFSSQAAVLARVHARLAKRFGFTCL